MDQYPISSQPIQKAIYRKDKRRLQQFQTKMKRLGLKLIPVIPNQAWFFYGNDYASGKIVGIAMIYYDPTKPPETRFSLESPPET